MTSEENPYLPVVVRSSVPAKASYQDYQQELRLDFWFSCAYCSIGEIEATTISFEIDHYEPRDSDPDLTNNYENLMWSCRICNRQKGQRKPNDAQRAAGIRFIRPDWDHPDQHFEVENVEILRPRTRIGEFSLVLLRLNRQQLRDLRAKRMSIYNSTQAILRGIQSLRGLKIDRFPNQIKLRVLKLKQDLEADVKKSIEDIDDLLKRFNQSRFIDPDPTAKEQNKRRREYLKRLHSLYPE
jgi:uncharacterized protein (TIGR02646 family)